MDAVKTITERSHAVKFGLNKNTNLKAVLDSSYSRMLMGDHESALSDIIALLCTSHKSLSREAFATVTAECLGHPIRNLIHEDPYARRSFDKPRGYAGDAVIMDFFYGLEGPSAYDTEHGKAIFQVSMESISSGSVRFRRTLLAKMIDDLSNAEANAQIVSIACGHLREASLSNAVIERRIGRLTALDQDTESISLVAEEVNRNGWQVELICASVKSLIHGKVKLKDAGFVYAAGLYDYLEAPVASRLTARMFGMLRSGGCLLLANFATSLLERGYMAAFLDWHLIYRDEIDVAMFARELPADQISSQNIFRDPLGNVIYLEIIKK